MQSQTPSTELIEKFDALFLDLDGVVYRSGFAVEHAVEALNRAMRLGLELRFLTNNASRTPEQVAQHLVSLGLEATTESVITSAMAIARVMSESVPRGSLVYLVGAEGLQRALEAEGFEITRNAGLNVAAVAQGHSVETSWEDLAGAGYLIGDGVPWFASNSDASIPTQRGLAPGNGAFVNLLKELTSATPEVAGKPFSPLFAAAAATVTGKVLMLGDRLDTDIEGAKRQGIASAWVNTGVHHIGDVLNAPPARRPEFLLGDLSGLFRDQAPVRIDGNKSKCGSAVAVCQRTNVSLAERGATREEDFRAVVSLGWHLRDVAGIETTWNATLDV